MRFSYAEHFICDDCAKTFPLGLLNACPECGGLLETVYDTDSMRRELKRDVFSARREPGFDFGRSLWRWHEFYPVRTPEAVVSLGEGDTPLVRSRAVAKRLGLKDLRFKNDGLMPTGSFKDRGFSVAVSFAGEHRCRRGFTYSSGNAGASFAAYARCADLDAIILVEYLANPLKTAMINLYGTGAVRLDFTGMEEITTMLEEADRTLGLYQFVNFLNPVRHEAMKSYAYEISEELGWQAPDVMIHPIGTGGGIHGAWKGFRELAALGWIEALPRMVGVQPAATEPIVRAFRAGEQSAGKHGDPAATIAQSIAADSPMHGGRRALKAMRDSGGFAESVTDEEILEAVRWLGEDGICAEPSSAVTVAALKKAVADGRVGENDRTVCVITGNGLKQPSALERAIPKARHSVNANIRDLEKLVETLWGRDR